jgi:hypothetical protein
MRSALNEEIFSMNGVQGGPALPVKVSLSTVGATIPAQPVYLVQPGEGYAVQAGPATPTCLITDPSYPVQGGPAVPIYYTANNALPASSGGPVIPIYCLNYTQLLTAMGVVNFTYEQKLRSLFGSSLVGLWPCSETSGVTAYDQSGNARDGTYRNSAGVLTGITLGQTGIGTGKPAPLFDGNSGYVNVYSTGVRDNFSSQTGMIFMWYKARAASVWSDGVGRGMLTFGAAGSNQVYINKNSSNSSIFANYKAANASRTVIFNVAADTLWHSVALTWNVASNRVRAYLDGVQQGVDGTIPGVWSGTIGANFCNLAADISRTAGGMWDGYGAYFMLVNAEPTPAEVLKCQNF